MQKILSLILSLIILFSSSVMGLVSGEITPKDFFEEVRTEFIEKISDGVGISNRVFSVFFDEGVSYFAAKKTVKEIGGTIVGYNSFLNEYKVLTDKRIDDLEQFCSQLQENDGIIYASAQIVFSSDSLIEKNYDYVPDDPWIGDNVWDEDNPAGYNWHLESVQALSAWQYKERMSTVQLGVVDSGVDAGHEDLEGKIVFPNRYFEYTNKPNSHGTHVCGIISANADNGVGICGVCPDSVLHYVDWEAEFDSPSQMWFDVERIYTGVYYCIKDGAKAVNLSLGSDMRGVLTRYPKIVVDFVGGFSSAFMSVLLKHGYDFVICQAAGNGNDYGHAINAENNLNFCSVNENNCVSELFGIAKPEVLDRIIIVGSAAWNGEYYYQPQYSNVGDRVDICAPGNGVLSTDIKDNDYYSFMSGTSMATPVVTGICGLVWSINPSFTGAQVKHIVCSQETAGPVVRATTAQEFDSVNYTDKRLVNAKLCVEKAIEITDN